MCPSLTSSQKSTLESEPWPATQDLCACLEVLSRGQITRAKLASQANISIAELAIVLRKLVYLYVLRANSESNAGFVFSSDLERLSVNTISSLLAPRTLSMISQLDLFPAIGSTNDELLTSTIKIGKAAVCLTEMQMAGRGRRGNVWHSNPFRNITMSVAYKFPAWPEATPSFALAAAVAITNLLRSKLGVNALIKWPNDLLVDRKKLGGILVEAAGAYDSDCLLVVGLGLNLHQRNEATLAGSDYQWTSLNDLGAGFGRNQLVADIIEALLDTFILFEQVGFAPFVEHWQTLSAFDGQRVRVIDKQDSFVGVQRGVDATGALMVEGYNGKVHQINDAGATVRGVDE